MLQNDNYRICAYCGLHYAMDKQRVLCPHKHLPTVNEDRIADQVRFECNEILTRLDFPEDKRMPDFFLPADHDARLKPLDYKARAREIFARGGFIGKGQAPMDHGLHIAQLHGHGARSPHWSAVEREHRKREPLCVACGYSGKELQVHHIWPFHLHPELELDPSNLLTLCERPGWNHHLLLGHLDEWQSYNEHVRDDVVIFAKMTSVELRLNSAWLARRNGRPK